MGQVEPDIVESNQPRSSTRGKHTHVIFCLLPQIMFVLVALGVLERGYWLLSPIIFLLIIVPLLDLLTGWQDDAHFVKGDFSRAETSLLHWNTRIYAFFYIGTVICFATNIHRFEPVEIGLIVVSSSFLGGIGFAAAHELLHAKEGIDQVLQRITTSFLFYPHYKLIHVRSHHLNVGTFEDENTAWMNESVYAYFYRSIPGSMIRSWHLEARRYANQERYGGWRIVRNKMFSYAVGQLALLIGLYLIAGLAGLFFYLAQIVGAHIVLESVNYIQHYGLLRERRDGEYEKTAAGHSWDTYHFFSSYVTFRVGHHSYHHLAMKPYYLLAAEPEAPKLPVGYFWSIAMVLLPPWWRRVINPRIKAGLQ
jgi:alkane 1-monooxygenase